MTDKTLNIVTADGDTQPKKLKDMGGGTFAERVTAAASTNLTATNTRVADTNAYAANDLVANSTTANEVVPMTFTVARSGMITGCRCNKTGTGVTAAGQRLHLYAGTAPTVNAGDNGAFLSNRAAGWLGSLDVSSFTAASDGAFGAGVPTTRTSIPVTAGQTLRALQMTLAGYAPASAEVFTWTLDYLED
jgi:hypothetical protein